MEILVLGLNYKTAPLELRERLAIPLHKASNLLEMLGKRGIFDERLLLSTCNRTEIYGVSAKSGESLRQAKDFLSEYSGTDLSLFENKLYILKQPHSVEHLFSVASGLDSMVLGETEIIGQVKDAYLAAHKLEQTGKVLNTLFQRSLKVAKDVRTQTGIGSGRVGVPSVSVDLAEKIFDRLKGIRVMVIGTGAMAAQVTKQLVSKGAFARVVSSRHLDRAQALAADLGTIAVPYDVYEEEMSEVDVLITSTLSSCVFISEKQIRSWMRARGDRPLFIVDIAVPRNVEPSAEKIDNVYLYNLDDLQGIANKNRAYRESQLSDCSRLIGNQTQYFMNWLLKEFGAHAA